MKIEKLTDAQIARFPEFVEKWTRIGLSTDPADRPRAEAAIRKMYEIAGLTAPRIVWCSSPLAMGVVRAVVQKMEASVRDSVGASVRDSVGASVGASVRDSVWDSVRDSVRVSVWASVWASVRASVWDSVRASVGDSVRVSVWDSVRASVEASVGASVRDSVWASVWASVRASVRDSVRDSVWDSVQASVWASVRANVGDSVEASVRDSVWDSVYGQHDAGSLGFYDYFREVGHLEAETRQVAGLDELSRSAGWALPHRGICWVSERHCVVLQDDRKRIHCETGPAILYPDGWAIHTWHGTRIPASWIEDKTALTAATALKWENVEQRRAACEILGWHRILRELDAKTIDRDPDPQIGELVEVSLPDAPRERFLRVMCGTGREFAIPVPPTTKTALAGNAWTYDIPANLLKQKGART